MSSTSVCTITVNLTRKTVSYSGVMSIRERVAVTITGATGSTIAGLILRLLKPDDHAEMAACESFAASGDDFVGTLDLSDAALASEFADDMANKVRSFVLQVWSEGDNSSVVTDRVYVMNNPLTAAIQAETLTPA